MMPCLECTSASFCFFVSTSGNWSDPQEGATRGYQLRPTVQALAGAVLNGENKSGYAQQSSLEPWFLLSDPWQSVQGCLCSAGTAVCAGGALFAQLGSAAADCSPAGRWGGTVQPAVLQAQSLSPCFPLPLAWSRFLSDVGRDCVCSQGRGMLPLLSPPLSLFLKAN